MAHPPWILLDTNLLVGLWMQDLRLSDLARALDSGTLPVATAAPMMAEALDVLTRPGIRRDATDAADAAATAAAERWLNARFRSTPRRAVGPEAPAAPRAPDPGDQFLWDLLAAHPDLVLWTRDKRLLRDRNMSGRVLLPPQAVHAPPRGATAPACQDPGSTQEPSERHAAGPA